MREARVALWAAIAAYAAGFSALSVLRDRAFSTGRFDLGNMVQAVWATAHGHPLAVTDLRGDQVSRLGAHVDPILVLLAPLWWLWPSPSMLVVAQTVAIALGALPVFWLARRHLGSERAALGFSLAYLLYPALQWMTLSEFHPVALATPLLLFAIWYLDSDRLVPFAVFALLAAMTKEHVALVIAGLGLWYALARRRTVPGAVIAALGVAWTAVAVVVVIPHFHEAGASSFYARYSEVGGSPRGVLETAVDDPGRILSTLFGGRAIGFAARLLLPLALLPFAAPLMLATALPELGLNALSATPTQTSIHFHYAAATIPVLLAAAVFGAARLARRRPGWTAGLGAVAVAVSLVANYALGAIPLWREVPGGETLGTRSMDVTEHDRIAARALKLIPDDAVVSATNSLGGHLSARRRVLSFPFVQDAQWVAVDLTSPGYADRIAPLPTAVQTAWLRRNSRWRTVFARDGIFILRRNPTR
jgi:uncharacterized membrane protein